MATRKRGGPRRCKRKGVDLFAGAGGFTEGAEAAGVEVTDAANHSELAIRVHSVNHPRVRHHLQDLRQFNFATLDPFDILLASPSCVGHSRAGQPARAKSARMAATHDAYRSTAWAVTDCLQVCRPALALVENVPTFLRWELLEPWLDCLTRLGYSHSIQVLRASRWGVPQRRDRAVIVARLDGPAISITEDVDAIEPGCDTVFDASARDWIRIRDMPKTVSQKGHRTAREKVTTANDKLDGALGWGQHVNSPSAWGVPASEPVNTLTTQAMCQTWWVRDGMYRTWNKREVARAMGFRDSYNFAGITSRETIGRLMGNAMPPPMATGAILQVTARL
jgi:DNA (cytosine-5)-methyltransferase 1